MDYPTLSECIKALNNGVKLPNDDIFYDKGIYKFEINKFTIFLDYFSIIILNYYLSPLVAFTIYFCFLHSIRHSITLIYDLDINNFNNGLIQFIKKNMEVKILRNIYEFKGLERPWNNLYDKMNSRAVFQSFDFNYYSWVYELNDNRNALALAVVYNKKELTAVFPFYIDDRKRLRFIKKIYFIKNSSP